MSYLKNACKYIYKYWFFILLLIPLVVISLISCNKKEEKIIYVTENDSYIIINDDNNSNIFNIGIYSSEKYSFNFDSKYLKNIYLTNKDESEKYKLELVNVKKTESVINNNNKSLSKYILEVLFDYTSDKVIEIPDAYIVLECENFLNHKLKIGSFIYKNSVYSDIITVHNLKGIVNDIIPYNDMLIPSTVGVLLNISSSKEILIKNIELIHGNGKVNQDQIIKLNTDIIDNNEDINSLLNNNYRMNYVSNKLKEDILLFDKINLLLPISYQDLSVIDKLGIVITYELDNEILEQIIYTMPIFSSVNSVMYNIYESN